MGEREILADNNQDNLTDGSKSASSCSDQNGNLNGSITGNDIKACMASTVAARQPDLDYLTQLLKDKKQLAAFSNIFSHLERLLDDEISRVRVALFQCKFAREPLQLPEPIGEIILRQEKIFVPTKSHPDFNFVGRILGPRGMTAKQLESETGCKIMVRGKGSIRDKKKEDMNRGKANWEHLQEELHVLIQSEDTPNRNEVKIKRAVEEVNKLLVPSPEGEDELKKKQLMELAIINGTFRNGTLIGAAPTQSPSSATTLGQFVVAPGFEQRLLAQQQNLNFSLTGLNGTVPGMMANSAALQSPALAGAPLIMQQATVSPQQQMALRSKADATQNGLLSISFGASPAASSLANSQLTALAQAQAAAFQLQQLQQGAGTSLMSANSVNGTLAPAFAQLPAATSAAATAAIAAQQQQQALNYQQLLLNSSQTDPNAMAIQLAQLQQQQQQQQQLQQQQQQLAALMQVSGASGAASFNAASDSISAISALPYATLNDGCGTPTGGYGGASNNNSRSRRFIGQSRDHPYGKRE